MAGIKRTPADAAFSDCVRERASWKCEACNRDYSDNTRALDASHYFGRRAYSVRFHPDNCFAHCMGCHNKFGENPDDFRAWAKERLGEGRIQILREIREDSNAGKLVKKNLKDVAKHYRGQLKIMKAKRADGKVGRIEFEGWL